MPKIKVNDITMNYDQQGSGEPLILIPYFAADSACYAFQVAEYAKHFTCISVDPRGAGETDKPEGTYSTELFADDVSGFMQAIGVDRAHISGLSLGAAVGNVARGEASREGQIVVIHSGWTRTDPFIKTVVESWQVMAKAYGNMTEMIIARIFPWCFTPELYAAQPDYIQSLAAFAAHGLHSPLMHSSDKLRLYWPMTLNRNSARSQLQHRSPSVVTIRITSTPLRRASSVKHQRL